MQLVPVSAESIRISHPLPFPLRDRHGVLLARSDFVVDSKAHLVEIEKRGGGLYIDVEGLEHKHRAYISRLLTMVRDDKATQ
jgi:hypothetical protein